MAGKVVLVDTSILIDFFRKTDKTKTQLIKLVDNGYLFSISTITEYEIFVGATIAQNAYWKEFLQRIIVYPFDTNAVTVAVDINNQLKQKRKQIDIADLFIAAIAISNNLLFATLNKKHFERIDGLKILE
ncbi:MAG TPA: type II toxin-antitoxin system VapC family toxin [Chitinophagaceae bacterium]|nr:type II toxin-antitoxin system VapC family toxin [Chitinophagaceae bacterium]